MLICTRDPRVSPVTMWRHTDTRNVPRNVVGKQWSYLSPAPFFNLGSCGRNCNVLIYFYRKSKQSKLLGHFAVVLPTQCWCTRFGELTAINNIGRTRRRARSEKKEQCWMDVSPLFLSATADFSQLPNRSKCGREKTNSLRGKTPSVNPSRNWKIC